MIQVRVARLLEHSKKVMPYLFYVFSLAILTVGNKNCMGKELWKQLGKFLVLSGFRIDSTEPTGGSAAFLKLAPPTL